MIKIKENFDNKKFLDFLEVNNKHIIELLKEENLLNKIRDFNEQTSKPINYIFVNTYYCGDINESNLYCLIQLSIENKKKNFVVEIFNNSKTVFGKVRISGQDFLNLKDYFTNEECYSI